MNLDLPQTMHLQNILNRSLVMTLHGAGVLPMGLLADVVEAAAQLETEPVRGALIGIAAGYRLTPSPNPEGPNLRLVE